MKKPKKSFKKKIGLPPGTLLPEKEGTPEPAVTALYEYTPESVDAENKQQGIILSSLMGKDKVSWLNVNGVHDSTLLKNIGSVFSIHPLVLEDIQNLDQRPKIEIYENYIFLCLKMLKWDKEQKSVDVEQISILIGESFVLTFQEKEGDVFDSVRQRITGALGRIRKENAVYLAYALIDAIVDNYFMILEELENCSEALEEALILQQDIDGIGEIHNLSAQISIVRRSLWPLQEVFSLIQKEEISLIKGSLLPYFSDVFDHTLRLIDSAEILKEKTAGFFNLHSANISNNMNSVMKVLTIIATIFIPLTFIAGIYGMNFVHMPELKSIYAYPIILGIMGGVALVMIIFFKKKKWL